MQVAAPQLLQLMNIRVQGGGRYIQLHSYRAIKLPCTGSPQKDVSWQPPACQQCHSMAVMSWPPARSRPAPPRPPPLRPTSDRRVCGQWQYRTAQNVPVHSGPGADIGEQDPWPFLTHETLQISIRAKIWSKMLPKTHLRTVKMRKVRTLKSEINMGMGNSKTQLLSICNQLFL